jgi:hypothetical protein
MMQRMFSGRPLSWLTAVGCFAAMAMAQSAQAQFATFTLTGPPAPAFRFENDQSVSGAATFLGSTSVRFVDQLTGHVYENAILTVDANTTADAQVLGSRLLQDINSFSGPSTIVIKDQTNTINLLSVTFTAGALGREGAGLLVLNGTAPPDAVSYSSDIFSFSSGGTREFELTFGSLNPVLDLDRDINGVVTNGLLRDFDAVGNDGSFYTGAGIASVPEPATVIMMSVGLVGLPGFLAIRRRRMQATV